MPAGAHLDTTGTYLNKSVPMPDAPGMAVGAAGNQIFPTIPEMSDLGWLLGRFPDIFATLTVLV